MLRPYSTRTLDRNDSSSPEVRAHASREFHSSFPASSSAALNRCPDRRPPFAARRQYLPSRCSRPDCLPRTGSRQARSARRRTAGIPPRRPRESFLPHFPAGCASEHRARCPQRDPSRRDTNRRRVAAKHYQPCPPAKPFAREYLLTIPKCQRQSPAPTARRKDSQTPSKYKSPARDLPPPYLFSVFRQATAIHLASCWHSRAEN